MSRIQDRARSLIQPLKERGHIDLHELGADVEAAGGDAVLAVFVFLILLEGDAERFGDGGLREAAFLAQGFQSLADGAVMRGAKAIDGVFVCHWAAPFAPIRRALSRLLQVMAGAPHAAGEFSVFGAGEVEINFGRAQAGVSEPLLDPCLGDVAHGGVDAIAVAQPLGAGMRAGDPGERHDGAHPLPGGGAAHGPEALELPAGFELLQRLQPVRPVEAFDEGAGHGNGAEVPPLVLAALLDAGDDDQGVGDVDMQGGERQGLGRPAAGPEDGLAEGPVGWALKPGDRLKERPALLSGQVLARACLGEQGQSGVSRRVFGHRGNTFHASAVNRIRYSVSSLSHPQVTGGFPPRWLERRSSRRLP